MPWTGIQVTENISRIKGHFHNWLNWRPILPSEGFNQLTVIYQRHRQWIHMDCQFTTTQNNSHRYNIDDLSVDADDNDDRNQHPSGSSSITTLLFISLPPPSTTT